MRVIKYKKKDKVDPFIKIEDKIASPASQEELEHDAIGITSPNLHRRVEVDAKHIEGELYPTNYVISKRGTNSYVTVCPGVHDEDSEDSEIP